MGRLFGLDFLQLIEVVIQVSFEQKNGKDKTVEKVASPIRRKKTVRIGGFTLEHWQIIAVLLAVYDYLAVIGSYFVALWLRFDGVYSAIPGQYLTAYIRFTFPFAIFLNGFR